MYIIITGATGTGKSSVTVELARRVNGAVVSADSMQVYKGMDIGTYKIREEEMSGIEHSLIDVIQPGEKFSASEFKEMACAVMEAYKASGKAPIVAGGTGLYITALTRGLLTAIEPTQEQKALLRAELEENGLESMVNLLNQKDPGAAALIDINNSRRVLRALELIEANKMPLSELRKTTENNKYKDNYRMFVLEAGREFMYKRLDKRVDEMIQKGLVKEVENLMKSGNSISLTAMQAIGYKETMEFLSGRTSEKQMIESIKQATRNYYKRQVTWFKKYPEAVRINMEGKSAAKAAEEILKHL